VEFGVAEYCDALRYFMNVELRAISKHVVGSHTDHWGRLSDLLNAVESLIDWQRQDCTVDNKPVQEEGDKANTA
jgi:hypothetical protein